MGKIELNEETAIDIIIFWVECTDGSISYSELESVQRILSDMDYSMENYHQTFSYINSLSTDNVNALIEEVIQYIKDNFSEDGKRLTLLLAQAVAGADGHVKSNEQKKLDRLKALFG
jgi:Glu-tRNA(Gln) amidotransferase subunit E-like FAD-binding protein